MVFTLAWNKLIYMYLCWSFFLLLDKRFHFHSSARSPLRRYFKIRYISFKAMMLNIISNQTLRLFPKNVELESDFYCFETRWPRHSSRCLAWSRVCVLKPGFKNSLSSSTYIVVWYKNTARMNNIYSIQYWRLLNCTPSRNNTAEVVINVSYLTADLQMWLDNFTNRQNNLLFNRIIYTTFRRTRCLLLDNFGKKMLEIMYRK